MGKDGPTTSLTDREKVAAVEGVAAIAAAQAGKALASLSRAPVLISPPEVLTVNLREFPSVLGGLDTPSIGVLVPFTGDMEGNALLLFPEKGAAELESKLFRAPGETGNDLRLSAFAEIANILTGTLLTVLSSLSEKIVVSLPPLLVQDMAGAILDTALAEAGIWTDEVTALIFNLTDAEGGGLVRSVLVPGRAGVELFLEAAGRLRSGP